MDFKNCFGGVADFLKRCFWFFISIEYFYFHICVIGLVVFLPQFFALGFIVSPILKHILEYQNGTSLDMFSNVKLYDEVIFSYIAILGLYLIQKVLGIFKKLDKLNFFIALLIVTIMCFLVTQMPKINIQVVEVVLIALCAYFVINLIKFFQ